MKTTPPANVTRLLRIAKPVDAQGHGLLKITQVRGSKAECDCYAIQTFPAYDGTVVGVEVRNVCDDTTYHCCVGSRKEETCSCKGYTYVGRCKHVDALRLMYANGWLPLPESTIEMPEDF